MSSLSNPPVYPTTIAVDFDGVIHAYSKGWHDGTCYDAPVAGALESLRRLMKRHPVFIFSTRQPAQIKDWLAKWLPDVTTYEIPTDEVFWNSIGVLGIARHKLAAAVYIDDRAVRFTNWTDIEKYWI